MRPGLARLRHVASNAVFGRFPVTAAALRAALRDASSIKEGARAGTMGSPTAVSLEDIRDPRGVPRWMEVGISGVPRQREWDFVRVVDLPELEGSSVSEVAFRLLATGSVAGMDPADLPAPAVACMAALVEEAIEPPCEVRALRRGVLDWSVAARRITAELVDLPAVEGVDEVSLAVAPDGGRTVLVNGEDVDPQGPLEQVLLELERQGRERFPAFVARAVRSTAGWELTVDPL